jgi:hypothetical protein
MGVIWTGCEFGALATIITPIHPSANPHSHAFSWPFLRPIEFAAIVGHTHRTPMSASTMNTINPTKASHTAED